MTEWREWVAWRRIVRVADDPMESAAAVGVDAARALRELAQTVAALAPEAYPEAVIDGVELLNQRRQGMAPIANLRNLVYLRAVDGVDSLIAALDEYVEHIPTPASGWPRSAPTSSPIPGRCWSTLTPPRCAPSSTRHGAGAGGSPSPVPRPSPPVKGRRWHPSWPRPGTRWSCSTDGAASEVIGGMDLVLAGAEALGPESAINKVGTGELAAAARRGGVPIYLVASTGKVLPPALFDDAARLQGRMGVSEVVPLAAVTGVITELGVLSPEEVSGLASRGAVAPELPCSC